MAGTAADILAWTNGGGDGDWDNASNWVTHAGSPTTTTPSAGEGVVMDERASGPITVAPSSSVALTSFTVTVGCKHGVGTAGTPLTNVSVDSGSSALFICAGTARYFFNGNIDRLDVNNTGLGGFYLSGGTAAEANAGSGMLQIASGATVTALYVAGGEVDANDGSTVTAADVISGSLKTSVSIATAEVCGGVLQLRGSAGSTTMNVRGGRVNMQSSGTITTLNGYRGGLDNHGALRTGATITTANIWSKTFVLSYQGSAGEIDITTQTNRGQAPISNPVNPLAV